MTIPLKRQSSDIFNQKPCARHHFHDGLAGELQVESIRAQIDIFIPGDPSVGATRCTKGSDRVQRGAQADSCSVLPLFDDEIPPIPVQTRPVDDVIVLSVEVHLSAGGHYPVLVFADEEMGGRAAVEATVDAFTVGEACADGVHQRALVVAPDEDVFVWPRLSPSHRLAPWRPLNEFQQSRHESTMN